MELRLYIADTTARSILAIANLRALCEHDLRQGCKLRVIDITKDPAAAFRDEILATPTLVRVFPGPQKAIIGTLSDKERVLRALDLFDRANSSSAHAHRPTLFLQSPASA